MTIINQEEIDITPSVTFMITDAEIKRIIELTNTCGGSAMARAGIIKTLSDVVHRTG